MANVVIVGAQWGDEGKAKITDLLAQSADVVVRHQGGCNAGHTVIFEGETYKFHLVPSGILYPGKLCIVGPGTVIDPGVLMTEIDSLTSRGISTSSLKLSDRAHLTLPFHKLQDQVQEQAASEQTGKKIGTTGRGIGPTYMDKVGRFGLRVGDLYDEPEILAERLAYIVALKNTQMKALGQPEIQLAEIKAFCTEFAAKLKPYVADTVALLHQAVADGKTILCEGAQGTLLDIDYGTYPFVTSSNATAGGACTGSGLGPTQIDRVIGVMKAYTTRVGEGPFPTELSDEIGEHFVSVGQEFGTTTGRKRRCGWFDAVIGKYSVQVNGLDGLAITKLDVMDGLSEVKLCVAYRNTKTGEVFSEFPSLLSKLNHIEPVYETFPGWTETVSKARQWDELPTEAKTYLERLSELIGCPISMVSIGAERNETIVIENPIAGAKRTLSKSPTKTPSLA